MASHLFDNETAFPDSEGFHFKIRGWFADKSPGHFDKFLKKVARNLELKTAGFRKDQNGVVFVSKDGSLIAVQRLLTRLTTLKIKLK